MEIYPYHLNTYMLGPLIVTPMTMMSRALDKREYILIIRDDFYAAFHTSNPVQKWFTFIIL